MQDSSVYTTGDISDILSGSSSLDQQAGPFSGLQYLDRNDILLKISRMIFEDFQNEVCSLSAITGVADAPTDAFVSVVHKFLEICDSGVKSIEKVCADGPKMDEYSQILVDQLSLERAAYSLILRIANSNKLLKDNQDLVSESFLTKLFRSNDQFRIISALLLWSETNAPLFASEFAKIAEEDAEKLSQLDNIYACTKIRGPVHIDSHFVDRIAAEDEEAVQTLNRVIFSLLRSGRLIDAKTLIQNLEAPALATFIFIREFLTNPSYSPLDRTDDMYDFTRSRMFFKQTARELIPTDDERIQGSDQCIWATLAGHLSTLLSHAQCSEDRLWSYLSCAAEALLDEALLEVHAKTDDEINLLSLDLRREQEDYPKDVHSIFSELRNNESRPYYALFEYLALEQWNKCIEYIGEFVSQNEAVPAHELRFFVHVMILLKLAGHYSSAKIADQLIERYISVLTQMRLNSIVPFYLFHLSQNISNRKMLDFLQTVTFEPEQKEVLENALKVGFDVPNLCRDLYQRFKSKNKFGPNVDKQQIGKSAEELLRAWNWLTFCGNETIWDSIIEANYLLRKFFLHNMISESIQLMQQAPENLPSMALDSYKKEFPGKAVPDKLNDALREFDCYQSYFEALSRYKEWQNHVEGSRAPELPSKLSDERWARMDIRRRTEYELGVQKARDCLQKYYRLVELYKKRAIEILETVLKMSDGWLVTIPLADEDLAEKEILERANDFVEIRKEYLANLLQFMVDIYHRSDEPMSVLDVAVLIMDPKYNLHKALDKRKLQKLLKMISRAGASLL